MLLAVRYSLAPSHRGDGEQEQSFTYAVYALT